MYPDGDHSETLSVIGTDAFMEFVESIQREGVVLERRPMGKGKEPIAPLVIEVDKSNPEKDIDTLDIEIPILSPRVFRNYDNLSTLDPSAFEHKPVTYIEYSDEEKRVIVFRELTTGEVSHETIIDKKGIEDYSSVIGYITGTIIKDLRLVGGYDTLYAKVKEFVGCSLFGKQVDLDDSNTLRNLVEVNAIKTTIESFKLAVNNLTIQDHGNAEIRGSIRLQDTRPFVAKQQDYVVPKKSVFNRIIGDSHLELRFASFLETCPEVLSYTKNYYAIHNKLDYVNADGNISNYFPDFIVKQNDGGVYVVETKGQEDLDVPLKMERLKQWCEDINHLQQEVAYNFIYVDEESFNKFHPTNFTQLIKSFREYKS